MEDKVDFSLYDDQGNRYVTKVTPAESRVLNVDHLKCFRMLKKLKAAGVQPQGEVEVESRSEHVEHDHQVSSSSGTIYNQKTGGDWKGFRTHAFLRSACKFRKDLRKTRVSDTTFWAIASDMKKMDNAHIYTAAQLREKIRNMKRFFNEAKKGDHGGEMWYHYWIMVHIFDEDMSLGTSIALEKANSSAEYSLYLPLNDGNRTQITMAGPSARAGRPLTPIVSEEESEASPSSVGNVFFGLGEDMAATTHPHSPPMEFGDGAAASTASTPLVPMEVLGRLPVRRSLIPAHPGDGNEDFLMDLSKWTDDAPIFSSTKLGELVHEDEAIHIVNGAPVGEILRSPLKKKSKKSPSVRAGIRSPMKIQLGSPSKTPKRKVATKASLVWPADSTGAFVKACLARKEAVRKGNAPTEVWKSVLDDLKDLLPGLAWQHCRERFNRMNKYFLETMVPVQGQLGGLPWPYYESFCAIHEIPTDYYDFVTSFGGEEEEEEEEEEDDVDGDQGEEEEDDGVGNSAQAAAQGKLKGKVWKNTNEVFLFLDLYNAKRHSFESTTSGLKHTYLFCQIAAQLHDYGLKVSGKQCKSKLGSLRKRFREEYDQQSKKTGAGTTKWVFYKRMLELDGGRPNIEAPIAVSVGRGLIYSQKGVAQGTAQDRGSRTRPAPASQQSGASKSSTIVKSSKNAKKPVYKSQKQDLIESRVRLEALQQLQVQTQARIATAAETMAQNHAQSTLARTALFEGIRDSLKSLLLQKKN